MHFKFFEWSKVTGCVYDRHHVYDGHFVKAQKAGGPWNIIFNSEHIFESQSFFNFR